MQRKMDYGLWDFPESVFASKNGFTIVMTVILPQNLHSHWYDLEKKRVMIDSCNNSLLDVENRKWQLSVRGTY